MTEAALFGTAALFAASSICSSLAMSFANASKKGKPSASPIATRAPAPTREPTKATAVPTSRPPSTGTPGPSAPGDPSLPGATDAIPPVVARPVTDRETIYTVRSTYYGPDSRDPIGHDNIFDNVPASQYSASQLRTIGEYFCAMSEKFMREGFMGAIIRVTGTKKTLDMVVVDLLPDRNDGKSVELDVHDQSVWESLGGDVAIGMTALKFHVVGRASIPVPDNSPWAPQKFGY